MAFTQTTATSYPDIVSQFVTFAASVGWTVNRNNSISVGREANLSRGSHYIGLAGYENSSGVISGQFFSGVSGILLNAADAFSSGTQWDRQVGYPVRAGFSDTNTNQMHATSGLQGFTGPFPTVYFFSPTADNIYCEFETLPGIFYRFGFGSFDLFNSGVPGQGRWFYGSSGGFQTQSTLFTRDVNNGQFPELVPFRAAGHANSLFETGSYARFSNTLLDGWFTSSAQNSNNNTGAGCQSYTTMNRPLYDTGPSPINGVSPLIPITVAINNVTHLSPLGTVNGIRIMDMENFQPGDTFTLGPDTWRVFPWFRKDRESANRGIAYLQVT